MSSQADGSAAGRSGRTGRRVLVGVLVALLLLLAADRLAAAAAQRSLARELQSSEGLAARPEVHIRGFPFLTQVLAGRYGRVDLRARDVVRDGVQVSDVDVRLEGVEVGPSDAFSGRVREVPVRSGTGSVLLSYADLNGLVRQYGGALGSAVTVGPAGPGRLRADGPLGLSLTASVEVVDGRLLVTPDPASLAALPPAASTLVTSTLQAPLAVPDLPFGARLTGGTIDDSGARLTATADGAVLRTR